MATKPIIDPSDTVVQELLSSEFKRLLIEIATHPCTIARNDALRQAVHDLQRLTTDPYDYLIAAGLVIYLPPISPGERLLGDAHRTMLRVVYRFTCGARANRTIHGHKIAAFGMARTTGVSFGVSRAKRVLNYLAETGFLRKDVDGTSSFPKWSLTPLGRLVAIRPEHEYTQGDVHA